MIVPGISFCGSLVSNCVHELEEQKYTYPIANAIGHIRRDV